MISRNGNDGHGPRSCAPTEVAAAVLGTEENDRSVEARDRHPPEPGRPLGFREHRPHVPSHVEAEVIVDRQFEKRQEAKRVKRDGSHDRRRRQDRLDNGLPVTGPDEPEKSCKALSQAAGPVGLPFHAEVLRGGVQDQQTADIPVPIQKPFRHSIGDISSHRISDEDDRSDRCDLFDLRRGVRDDVFKAAAREVIEVGIGYRLDPDALRAGRPESCELGRVPSSSGNEEGQRSPIRIGWRRACEAPIQGQRKSDRAKFRAEPVQRKRLAAGLLQMQHQEEQSQRIPASFVEAASIRRRRQAASAPPGPRHEIHRSLRGAGCRHRR